MVHRRIIPLRGITEDWYGDKESELIEKNKHYAKTLINNQLLGSPEFEKHESFLVKPSEEKRRQ
jgi:hypothetical protein